MTRDRAIQLFILVLSCIFATSVGGVSPSIVPESYSDNIEAIKSVDVQAFNRNPIKTGVHVTKGDYYTLIVEGRVILDEQGGSHARKSSEVAPPERLLEVMIDNEDQIAPPINATFPAPMDGEISLIVKDYEEKIWHPWFRDHRDRKYEFDQSSGSYRAMIIVWNTKTNLDRIVEFFHQFKSNNPDSEVSDRLIAQAELLISPFFKFDALDLPMAMGGSILSNKKGGGIKPSQKVDRNPDVYPPLMLLLTPREGQITAAPTINLIGVVEDDIALQKVVITINREHKIIRKIQGKTLESTEPQARLEFNEKIPIVVGDNHIEIVNK